MNKNNERKVWAQIHVPLIRANR